MLNPLCYAVAEEWVYHIKPESVTDTRLNYPIALLKLSLEKAESHYQLRENPTSMPQSRAFRLLEAGKGIDVLWSQTSIEREEKTLPIRIPIDRGLLGWRLLLIRNDKEDVFTHVNTSTDLAKLLAGQGHDWPDTQVLLSNHFKVIANNNYEALFEMLNRGHIDYIPRGLGEIWPEITAHNKMSLTIEPKLALHYPAAFYFFVNNNNIRLAQAIETGMLRAMKDGSMEALFQTYFGEAITRAQLTHRNIIDLENNNLPKATPLANKDYWFTIADQKL